MSIFSFDVMGKFLRQILVAVLLFTALILGVYFVLRYEKEKTNSYHEENYIFVWGDSQMYQGLDVVLLKMILKKQILTSAGHGSGIYDFLVSEKNIPNNAMCILAFPECALLRRPLSDYNRTGFELSCLQSLYSAGCSLDECLRIANLNSDNIHYKAFRIGHIMYPYSEKIVYPEPLSGFCGMFSEEKDYFMWKAKSYEMGLQNLYDKHNQIILVQFPFEQQVEICARNSINRHLTDSLKFELIEKYALQHDSIVLHSDSLLMHDLSHMNEVGARLFTCEIADILCSDTVNNYFIEVKIR